MLEHFFEALGDELVRMRWLGHLTRVAVQGDDRRGVVVKDRASHLPRMYGRALRLAFSECL
jgi:hypothetical protein